MWCSAYKVVYSKDCCNTKNFGWSSAQLWVVRDALWSADTGFVGIVQLIACCCKCNVFYFFYFFPPWKSNRDLIGLQFRTQGSMTYPLRLDPFQS